MAYLSNSQTNQPRKENVGQILEETETNVPDYTSEQEDAIKRIQKCMNVKKSRNHFYEILGVSKDATIRDINNAYKKLALLIHPDKNKCPGSSEAFQAVGNAVEVLTDAERRKRYDLYGSDEERVSSEGSDDGFGIAFGIVAGVAIFSTIAWAWNSISTTNKNKKGDVGKGQNQTN